MSVSAVVDAVGVGASQDDEQRRRVDAAVVTSERHFAEPRHFAVAGFVQDFSRLRVLLGVDGICLRGREVFEHATRDARVDP